MEHCGKKMKYYRKVDNLRLRKCVVCGTILVTEEKPIGEYRMVKRRWSDDDVELLISLNSEFSMEKDIVSKLANILQRTEAAVISKIARLRSEYVLQSNTP
jgi:ligand-binding sensor protein